MKIRNQIALLLCLALPVGAQSLKKDGTIGKVVDAQGMASVRPLLGQRWSPAEINLVVKPGDWIRTDTRGANAVKIRLQTGSTLTLGPGALVECIKADEIKLMRGDVEVAPAEGKTPRLQFGDTFHEVPQTSVFRHQGDKAILLEEDPNWLKGFKGTVTKESMGTLLAKVDGRNVPLTVGFHKVTIDIRDQIARTTIEESFVNRTGSRLEGVFYFPLPQDASISGFGMWIGDELVEADIVEKQRAREIYETILREKRDPGLLEWTGGNLFKARVFPIFAHSEKRIKITYTQVLPARAGHLRYSYALQSEMLQQTPLRELNIGVNVSSDQPLKKVTSLNHDMRADQTKHAARLEFNAQEYTPNQDFELDIELARKQEPITIIPHRRGGDGYFLMLLNPPGDDGDWERNLIPEGKPLDLILLADSSGSIHASMRETRDAFVTSILNSLGAKDSFRLAVCDLDTTWWSRQPKPVTDENIAAARDFLAGRTSLGWTDLDQAFDTVMKQAGPNTQVIYIGDGIVTKDDGDPVALAQRLRKNHSDKATCHAVAVGSSYESGVLKAIASLGNGSMRIAKDPGAAAKAAYDLLTEVAQPVLKDLAIDFEDLKVARIYPEELPNLPSGAQQILVGRYLPESPRLASNIRVSGTLDGKKRTYRGRIDLTNDESGNAFIPRLWARQHLDALLEQGRTPEVKDDIIALSEDYQIITPYTSFLVLESDADRERFGVKRSFRMRDGEKFFAEGRDAAQTALLKRHMQRAGTWRVGLRNQALREFAGLGRAFPQTTRSYNRNEKADAVKDIGRDFDDDLTESEAQKEDIEPTDNNLAEPTEPALQPEMPPDPQGMSEKLSVAAPRQVESDEEMRLPSLSAPVLPDDPDKNRADLMMHAASEGGAAPFGDYDAGKRRAYYGNGLSAPPFRPMQDLFPYLYPAVAVNPPVTSNWSNQALAISSSLLRTNELARLESFSVIETISTRMPDGRFQPSGVTTLYAGPGGWTRRTEDVGAHAEFEWMNGEERGLLRTRFNLGRFRKAVPADQPPRLSLHDFSLYPLSASHNGYKVTVEDAGPGRKQLIMVHPTSHDYVIRILVDTERKVVLTYEQFLGAQTQTTMSFSEFKQVGGRWWATRIETSYEGGGVVQHHLAIETGTAKDPKAPALEEALMLPEDLATLAKDHPIRHLLQIGEYGGRKEWHKAREHLDLLGPNLWLRIRFMKISRNEAELKKLVFEQARAIAKEQATDGFQVAQHLEQECRGLIKPEETLDLLDILKPTYTRKGHDLIWANLRINALDQAGRPDEATRELAEIAKAHPEDFATQQAHLARLQTGNQQEEVLAWLEELAKHDWPSHRLNWFTNYKVNTLRRLDRHDEMLALLKTWAAANPTYLIASQETLSALFNVNRLDEARAFVEDRLEKQTGQVSGNDGVFSHYAQLLYNKNLRRERLAFLKRWVSEDPKTGQVQQTYVSALVEARRFDEAKSFMTNWLANTEAPDNMKDQVSHHYVQQIQYQNRIADCVTFMKQWTDQNPTGIATYQTYLGLLMRNNQLKMADELALLWLTDWNRTTSTDSPAWSRMEAGLRHTLGYGQHHYTSRIEEPWFEPIARVARELLHVDSYNDLLNLIMTHGQFQRTDVFRELRDESVTALVRDHAFIEVPTMNRYITWARTGTPVVPPETWTTLAKGLEKRWEHEKNIEVRNSIGSTLADILFHHDNPSSYLVFLRRQYTEGPEKYRASYLSRLYTALLRSPWEAEHEEELFTLFPSHFGDHVEPAYRVQALNRLVDAMVAGRVTMAMDPIKRNDQASRTEYNHALVEAWREARTALANRLLSEPERQRPDLASWILADRLYLDVKRGRAPADIAAECWEAIGQAAPKEEPGGLEAHLHRRFRKTLAYLASRLKAEPALGERLLAWYAQAVADHPNDRVWKLEQLRLLLALDRPDALEAALRSWIQPDAVDREWRVSLAYLMAEQNRLNEAVGQFETIEQLGELGAADYRTLADWYLVLDQKANHEKARQAELMAENERNLQRRLQQELQRIQSRRDEVPESLDPRTMEIFTALFRKSDYPQNYVSLVQQFYRYTHDFQLLACLSEGLVGPKTRPPYPMIHQTGSVLQQVREEATIDTLAEHLDETRKRANTASQKRGLYFLEMLARARAGQLGNQPGPHIDAATKALKQACKGGWEPGERLQAAQVISPIGPMTHAGWEVQQLLQLERLYKGEAVGSSDRIQIALLLIRKQADYKNWERTLFFSKSALEEFPVDSHQRAVERLGMANDFVGYIFGGLKPEAIALMQRELERYRKQTGGMLDRKADNAVNSLVNMLTEENRYLEAETFLLGELKRLTDPGHRIWYEQQLYNMYVKCLTRKGEVAWGKGQDLYDALDQALRKEFAAINTFEAGHQMISFYTEQLCIVYRRAKDLTYAGIEEDLLAFAFKEFPSATDFADTGFHSPVNTIAYTLRDLRGFQEAAQFLIVQLELEPEWLRRQNYDGWTNHADELALWRTKANLTVDWQDRLLALVLDELRLDLSSQRARRRYIYYHDAHYWPEQVETFQKTALEIWETRKDSNAATKYIASYVYDGLRRRDEAVAMLFEAYNSGHLFEEGQVQLVSYLQQLKRIEESRDIVRRAADWRHEDQQSALCYNLHAWQRFEESIPILRVLMLRSPATLDYRVRLMHAYFQTKQADQLLALLKETDAFFHNENRWTEPNIATLAYSCLSNQLLDQSIAYYNEVIPLHQRTAPNRGIGNGTLSIYYNYLADAHAGLGQTAEAVEAAAGAVVSWGPSHGSRAGALNRLEQVLISAPNLEGYATTLDQSVEESGFENPILRKALGKAFLRKQQYDSAIHQLELAIESQPNDKDTHQSLVAAYDKKGDAEGALRALYASLELNRRELYAYRNLAERLMAQQRNAEAERAYAGIVEAQPEESESHAMLAEIRQGQDRWPEAIVQWQQVARIRTLEPTGFQRLAAAYMHQEDFKAAEEQIDILLAKTWPRRFGNVHDQARALRAKRQ